MNCEAGFKPALPRFFSVIPAKAGIHIKVSHAIKGAQ